MVEPEVAFADLEDIAKLAENMLKYVFKAVLEERRDDMEFFAQRIEKTAISRLEEFVEKDFALVKHKDFVFEWGSVRFILGSVKFVR
jgi:asparaginyl-tRNA synthetase